MSEISIEFSFNSFDHLFVLGCEPFIPNQEISLLKRLTGQKPCDRHDGGTFVQKSYAFGSEGHCET